jgi:hypothetical protein
MIVGQQHVEQPDASPDIPQLVKPVSPSALRKASPVMEFSLILA